MESEEQAAGVLLGLACGDALGRPFEFRSPESIASEYGRPTEMIGHGTHGQPAGTITDDAEMALCIARSLAERGGFDPADVAARFVEWYESDPFDIGVMTRDVLTRIRSGEPWDEAGKAVWEDRPEGSNAGNGSLMRCAPYAIAFDHDRELLRTVSRESSRITHADPRCQYGCAALNLVVSALLAGRDDPISRALELLDDAPAEILDVLRTVPDGVAADDLSNSGYVVHTLEAGLYHGLTAETAEDAIANAVAMGGDADTIGAVAGAVAGARFGASGLPDSWVAALDERDELRALAGTLARTRMPPKPVSHPVGQQQTVCAVCGDEFEGYGPEFASRYANLVCEACDERAVNERGESVEFASGRDDGDNPVFVDGRKCWRRYRFGGYVTRLDEHDCESVREFHETHRGR